MKRLIVLLSTAVCWQLALSAASAFPTPTPTKDPGTPSKTAPVQTTLLAYTKNGIATTQTNTSGEFPSQLTKTATVNETCVLQWARKKSAPQKLNGNLTVSPWNVAKQENTGPHITKSSQVIPAGAVYATIPFTFPAGTKPGDYRAIINSTVSNTDLGFENYPSISTSVILTYTGKTGPGPAIKLPTPAPRPKTTGLNPHLINHLFTNIEGQR